MRRERLPGVAAPPPNQHRDRAGEIDAIGQHDPASGRVRASTFRLDVKGAEVRRALSAAGVEHILLKGPAFARLLYGADEARPYVDIDVLVKPTDAATAHSVLGRLEFQQWEPPSLSGESDPEIARSVGGMGAFHGGSWVREADQVAVDLHLTLPQVTADRLTAWEQIRRHTTTLIVAGEPALVLDAAGSALLAALHAAHHGPQHASPLRDLERAVKRLDFDTWLHARELAERLGAEAAMGMGLGLTEEGSALAERLGLVTGSTPAARMLWSGAPFAATVVQALKSERSWSARARLIKQITLPSARAMRHHSSLARRGRRGLVAAYAVRTGRLVARAPSAYAAWRRGRW